MRKENHDWEGKLLFSDGVAVCWSSWLVLLNKSFQTVDVRCYVGRVVRDHNVGPTKALLNTCTCNHCTLSLCMTLLESSSFILPHFLMTASSHPYAWFTRAYRADACCKLFAPLEATLVVEATDMQASYAIASLSLALSRTDTSLSPLLLPPDSKLHEATVSGTLTTCPWNRQN
jgi:hypothetical protein